MVMNITYSNDVWKHKVAYQSYPVDSQGEFPLYVYYICVFTVVIKGLPPSVTLMFGEFLLLKPGICTYVPSRTSDFIMCN